MWWYPSQATEEKRSKKLWLEKWLLHNKQVQNFCHNLQLSYTSRKAFLPVVANLSALATCFVFYLQVDSNFRVHLLFLHHLILAFTTRVVRGNCCDFVTSWKMIFDIHTCFFFLLWKEIPNMAKTVLSNQLCLYMWRLLCNFLVHMWAAKDFKLTCSSTCFHKRKFLGRTPKEADHNFIKPASITSICCFAEFWADG